MSGDERTAVKTYVPRHQKDEWQRHADRLDMSQSEFVRTMVQAGRRGFDAPTRERRAHGASEPDSDDTESTDGAFEERVLAVIRGGEHPDWEDLLSELTDDVESRLEETLQRLQTDNRVQYSGRHDGYALLDDD